VKDPQVMLELIAALKPGETERFRLRREQRILEIPVKIGKRPALRQTQRE
jgi:serine protease DegQ